MTDIYFVDSCGNKTEVNEGNYFDYGLGLDYFSSFDEFEYSKYMLKEQQVAHEGDFFTYKLQKYKFTYLIKKKKLFHGLCGFKYEYAKVIDYAVESGTGNVFKVDIRQREELLCRYLDDGWKIIPKYIYRESGITI